MDISEDLVDESVEEGECSTSEDEEDDDIDLNPAPLFDALAAAQEANQRFLLQSSGQSPLGEEARLPENYLMQAFTQAVRTGWEADSSEGKEEPLEQSQHWKLGDRCYATFSGDERTYAGRIVVLKEWKQAAVVKFLKYGDEEEVKFEDMTKVTHAAVKAKKRKSGYVKHRSKAKKKCRKKHIVTKVEKG